MDYIPRIDAGSIGLLVSYSVLVSQMLLTL